MLGGGGGDNQQGNANGGKGTVATSYIVLVSAATIITLVVAFILLMWKRRNQGTLNTETTAIAASLITTSNADCGEKASKKYSLLSQQQNILYPNLSLNDATTTAPEAPDIMIPQSYPGKQCLVSIANRGIPGPESCV